MEISQNFQNLFKHSPPQWRKDLITLTNWMDSNGFTKNIPSLGNCGFFFNPSDQQNFSPATIGGACVFLCDFSAIDMTSGYFDTSHETYLEKIHPYLIPFARAGGEGSLSQHGKTLIIKIGRLSF